MVSTEIRQGTTINVTPIWETTSVRILYMLVLLAPPLAGQALPPPPPPVDELPGAGRPVAREMHQARREALLDRIGVGVIAIPAAGRHTPRAAVSQDSDFRQDDYFFYLTGIETPEAWLLLGAFPGGERQVTLYLPARDPSREQWMGVGLGPGDVAAVLTGIGDVRELDQTAFESDILTALNRTGGVLHSVVARRAPNHPLIEAWMQGSSEVHSIVPSIDSMRVVKDSAEVAALRRAAQITAEAHKAAMRAVSPGMFEYQLEATIEYTFRDLGADRVGFPSIVGSGPNSTILHYDSNRRQMQAGDLVVMDIGAEYGQYTADVTRTIPVSGHFTERQRALYDLVLGAQLAVIDAIKPGKTIRELQQLAREYMQENSGDMCGTQGCAQYFIHGLSHWLGMRVHDVGDYRMPLEPGMVFTVEPGLYISEENLGIRIEDDVLVTEDGCEVLSVAAPKTIRDIEELMRAAGGSGPSRR
jgi:Xaa-Pro aminopeptidase